MPVRIWYVLRMQIEALAQRKEETTRDWAKTFSDPVRARALRRRNRLGGAPSRRAMRRAVLRQHARRPSRRAA